MIGSNSIRLNQATVQAAVEAYLKARYLGPLKVTGFEKVQSGYVAEYEVSLDCGDGETRTSTVSALAQEGS